MVDSFLYTICVYHLYICFVFAGCVLSGIYYSVLNPTLMCEKQCGLSTIPANTTLTQCWSNAGPQSATLAHHQISTGSAPHVCWELRPIARWSGSAFCWRRVQTDTDPMSVNCGASVAGAG